MKIPSVNYSTTRELVHTFQFGRIVSLSQLGTG